MRDSDDDDLFLVDTVYDSVRKTVDESAPEIRADDRPAEGVFSNIQHCLVDIVQEGITEAGTCCA